MSAHGMRVTGGLYRYPTGRLPQRYPIEALLAEIMARVTDEEERGEQLRISEACEAVEELATELCVLVYSATSDKAVLRRKATDIAVAAIRFMRDACGKDR